MLVHLLTLWYDLYSSRLVICRVESSRREYYWRAHIEKWCISKYLLLKHRARPLGFRTRVLPANFKLMMNWQAVSTVNILWVGCLSYLCFCFSSLTCFPFMVVVEFEEKVLISATELYLFSWLIFVDSDFCSFPDIDAFHVDWSVSAVFLNRENAHI